MHPEYDERTYVFRTPIVHQSNRSVSNADVEQRSAECLHHPDDENAGMMTVAQCPKTSLTSFDSSPNPVQEGMGSGGSSDDYEHEHDRMSQSNTCQHHRQQHHHHHHHHRRHNHHHHRVHTPVGPELSPPLDQPVDASAIEDRDTARRHTHSVVERRRRERINDKIVKLKEMVPTCVNQTQLHKETILQSAIDYIRYLENVVREYRDIEREYEEHHQPPTRPKRPFKRSRFDLNDFYAGTKAASPTRFKYYEMPQRRSTAPDVRPGESESSTCHYCEQHQEHQQKEPTGRWKSPHRGVEAVDVDDAESTGGRVVDSSHDVGEIDVSDDGGETVASLASHSSHSSRRVMAIQQLLIEECDSQDCSCNKHNGAVSSFSTFKV